SIKALGASHYGVLLSRAPIDIPAALYWARARTRSGYATHLALRVPPARWSAWSSALLPPGERLSYEDNRRQHYRVAVVHQRRLEAVLYLAKSALLPSLHWLLGAFERPLGTPAERRALLAGRSLLRACDGEIVCACFGVARARIEGAVETGARTIE